MSKSFSDDLKNIFVVDINALCEKLGVETIAGKEFITFSLANALLFERKQRDYGPRNISSFGTFGVVVRMNDKHERLKTLFGKGRKKRAHNESIQDSLRDISNYAIIAAMVERGAWPDSEDTGVKPPVKNGGDK